MARIRTIKPDFFTSEDIVRLSPLARLFYIATWCEADKQGRLVWKPMTFKLRYFPGDNCDIDSLCAEVIDAGLVVLYGAGYAHIPSFKAHQHINARESLSQLPDPAIVGTGAPRVGTRQARVDHVHGGMEGKGKEGDKPDESGETLPPGFADFWKTWPRSARKQARGECLKMWKKAGAESCAPSVLAHIESLKLSNGWTKEAGEYIPAPLAYLKKRSWEGAEAAELAAQEAFI